MVQIMRILKNAYIIIVFSLTTLSQSCAYIYDVADTYDNRRNHSTLRYDQKKGKTRGKIRTDGLYVRSILLVNPEKDNRIIGMKFFDDGTVMTVSLIGTPIDSIKPNLEDFQIDEMQLSCIGAFEIKSDYTLYTETYSQTIRYLYPSELLKETYRIIDKNTLSQNSSISNETFYFTFVPCSIPLTSHHPFKSNKWLWKDMKERKQYLKEWRKIKKKRRKSTIKYKYQYG